ncbi:hypothetical protein AGDE_03634 [Angomonas deanei]|uniref:Uncharacterized protein n=1 Tax=Angomonas deanei TaxID=59799 RepID=A0A7G2C0Y2_9TRYP|nr:hypothetical protein AGDE_03634 [Angomonas deanei]CAD2213296.1 hypothetical protein, conserved [Angomonas deanei]|eukprot:EPY40294.1 hypothetical protein AGDE_03634 [Angomonas deanei]
MLGISSTQRLRVEAERDDTLRQIAVTQNEMEDLEKSLENHVKFMRNLSSTTAEQLKQRYDTVQKSVETAEEENNALRQKIADLIERKEEELRQSEEEVAAQQHHIDEKALLFGIQLKERLNKARS